MKVGIVGLPNVGKSTLFNALTKNYAADAENFPFCTIDPNVGVVEVKDPRVDRLYELSESDEKIYAAMNFLDIAGLVKGASKGEGLGNQFLSHVREVDAIVQVVRLFEDDDVVHVEGGPDPERDVDIINTELIMADLQLIEKQLPDLERKLKGDDKEAKRLYDLLQKLKAHLGEGGLAYDLISQFDDEQKQLIKPFNLLTNKPFIYALNVEEEALVSASALIEKYGDQWNKPVAVISAKFESDILDLSDEEKQLFIEDIANGQDLPTLDDLIKLAFDEVGLMYFFTSGEKETRAWTIKKGSTAPEAAGAIHTDFQEGFIKAEVVTYEDFVDAGGRVGAKEAGNVRLEGKDYIVKDGDIIHFKCNK